MNLIKQPVGSSLCGHCSMAMVLEDNVENIIASMGTNEEGGTNVFMVYEELNKRGIGYVENELPDNRRKMDLSGKGIAFITGSSRKWGHAVAFNNGVIYDPAGYLFEGAKELRAYYKKYVKGVKVYATITLL